MIAEWIKEPISQYNINVITHKKGGGRGYYTIIVSCWGQYDWPIQKIVIVLLH